MGDWLSKECTGTLPDNNRPYILYGSQSVPIMGNVLFKEILDSAPIQELFFVPDVRVTVVHTPVTEATAPTAFTCPTAADTGQLPNEEATGGGSRNLTFT